MLLTESQQGLMETVITCIKNGNDGHALIKNIRALQQQGIDVYEYINLYEKDILTENNDENS